MTEGASHSNRYLASGAALDLWIVEKVLGAGGMGVVYQARHSQSEMRAALKVLPEHSATSLEILQRFRREVQTLARIRHPGVIQILQESLDHLPPFFVMELVPNGTLAARIEEAHAPGGKGFGAPFLARIARELVEALAAAHAEKVIHRDIKPHNVLFTQDDHAKLADFGMAKAMDLTNLTVANRVMGTLPYMAPEALQGQPATEQTDFYQLGVTLYEMATGKRPYPGEVLVGVLGGRPLPPLPRLADSVQGLPRWFQGMLDRLTAFRPEDRYRTAAEIIEDIEKGSTAGRRVKLDTTVSVSSVPPLVKPKPPTREAAPAPERRFFPPGTPLWMVAAPIALAFVLFCAAIAWMLRGGEEPPPPQQADTPRPAATTAPAKPSPPRAAQLPSKPVLVELPDSIVVFGPGAPPSQPPIGAVKVPQPRVTSGGALWQVAMLTESPPSAPEKSAIGALLRDRSEAIVMRLGAAEYTRFGDELNIRVANAIEGEFYPRVRGAVSRKLGLGAGRIAVVDIPSEAWIRTLVGPASGPPWLEMQLNAKTPPASTDEFHRRLAEAIRRMEPALETVTFGRGLNTEGWKDGPEAYSAMVTGVRAALSGLFPSLVVGPGSFALPAVPAGVDLTESASLDLAMAGTRAFLRQPVFKGTPRLELHVTDIGSKWTEGFANARKAAATAGLGDVPWDLCLQRLPKTSPRYAGRSVAGDDIEMRQLLRSAARAVAAGARRIWFADLRSTLQGPVLVDVFAASVNGKVVENEGSGARAFRYVLSRLAHAQPSRQPLPGGVQGVVVELPNRHVWFLWAPDGARRWVQVPSQGPAALVVRVCPVAAWNRGREAPIQVLAQRDGLLGVDVDDGLTVVEEIPRIAEGLR